MRNCFIILVIASLIINLFVPFCFASDNTVTIGGTYYGYDIDNVHSGYNMDFTGIVSKIEQNLAYLTLRTYNQLNSVNSTLDYYLVNLFNRFVTYFAPISGDNLTMSEQLYQVRQLIPAIGSQVADVSSKLLVSNQYLNTISANSSSILTALNSVDNKFTSENSYLSNISANTISGLSSLNNIYGSVDDLERLSKVEYLNDLINLARDSSYTSYNELDHSSNGTDFNNDVIISSGGQFYFKYNINSQLKQNHLYELVVNMQTPRSMSNPGIVRFPSNYINQFFVGADLSNLYNVYYYAYVNNDFLHIFFTDALVFRQFYISFSYNTSIRIVSSYLNVYDINDSFNNRFESLLQSIDQHLEKSTSIVTSDNDVNIEVDIDIDTGNGLSGVVSKIKSLYNTGVNLTAFITALNFFDNIAWFSPDNSDIVNTHSYSYTDLYD